MGTLSMTLSLFFAVVLSLGPVQADTTWSVGSGDRLSLENFHGDVRVETWDRDIVEMQRLDDVMFPALA